MVEAITLGIVTGVFGYLMANVLTLDGEVLSWLPGLVQRLVFAPAKRHEYNFFQNWIAKITYDCAKCIAGNLALWIGVFSCIYSGFCISQCYVVVVLAIFFAFTIEKYVQ